MLYVGGFVLATLVRPADVLQGSLLFGALYWRHGLLPGVIMHYTYDVVWMALPVFLCKTATTDQTLVVACALLPLVLTPALGAPAPAPEAQAAEAQDPPTFKRKRVVKDSARRRAVKERGGSGLLDVLDASVQWLVDHQGADGSWHPVDFNND